MKSFQESLQAVVGDEDRDAKQELAEFFANNDINPREFASMANVIATGLLVELEATEDELIFPQGIAITFMLGFKVARQMYDGK